MTRFVVVRFTFEGFHRWPGAEAAGHGYLASVHRHMFHVEAKASVDHDERQIEFIQLKRTMEDYCRNHFAGPHDKSCESMAGHLLRLFDLQSVSVFEDGENGAEVVR